MTKIAGMVTALPSVVVFRPLTPADLPMLHEWLGRPHVAEWWDGVPSLDEVEADFGPMMDDRSTTRAYIALGDGRPIGYIQSYVALGSGEGWWPDEVDPGVRGIDQFLADADHLGRGLGTRMVRAFIACLFADPEVTRIQTDPSPRNARAIRCYQKAGFDPMRVVDTPDGPALLMICERDRAGDP
jgi:RimJ/RimL family protein N-acetyltransferase